MESKKSTAALKAAITMSAILVVAGILLIAWTTFSYTDYLRVMIGYITGGVMAIFGVVVLYWLYWTSRPEYF